MTLAELTNQAVALRARFDTAADAAGKPRWSKADFMAGLVGDTGDLMKLVMARDGLREIPDVDRKLGHELADCLWSILILAQAYEVDLESEFQTMIAKVTHKLDSK